MSSSGVVILRKLSSIAVLAVVPIDSLRPHEEFINDRVEALVRDMLERGVIIKPILVDASTLTILDGHHRVEAMRRIGARKIPAVLVNYDSECVSVGSWRPGVEVSKSEVRRRGVSGDLYMPRTSRHRVCFEIPDVRYPVKNLL